jgi:hypothetical protein
MYFISPSSLALAQIPKYGKSWSQLRTYFGFLKLHVFSNMDKTSASEVQLRRILCLKVRAYNAPQLCQLSIFHLMLSSGPIVANWLSSKKELQGKILENSKFRHND